MNLLRDRSTVFNWGGFAAIKSQAIVNKQPTQR